MPRAALWTGVALIVLGVGSYVATGRSSLTAMIPAFFGLPLVILGWIAARASTGTRKHTMHVAAALALIGLVVPAMQALPKLGQLLAGQALRPTAVVAQLCMALVCGVFLGFCIKSFIDARRARE